MFFDSFLFTAAPIFIGICFILVFSGFIFTGIKGFKMWNYNNSQPVLTVWAKVVTKRTDVSHHSHVNHGDNTHHTSNSTYYYVTFEVESGDRMEFAVMGNDYGLLVEGDTGKLTFQGSRYKSFLRNK